MRLMTLVLALGLAAPLAGGENGAKMPLLRPPLWEDPDNKTIPEPPEREASELYDLMRNTWLRQMDFGYKGLQGAHRPALNVNAWDEVPDSSWFRNRLGRSPMSVDELIDGAPGLSPQPGKWAISRLKTAGYTPGLHFEDEAGERFVLKFDLAAAPERNSAADKIGSLLVHAAGYYAPFNSIVYFFPGDLVVGEDATYEDLLGRKRPMTQEDLDDALALVAGRPDGTIRGLASHYIKGVPKGYFPYWGVRQDDPNDVIPHELRRELRGFRVIASWFNHVDTKEVNTFDAFVEEEGSAFLRHFFIDFGSTMGSGDFQNGPKRVGHEYMFDAPSMWKSFYTFGAWERPWDREVIRYAEVGHFESELFDPPRWKPNYPNLAFEEMDDSDGYWGAKIVTAFNDELVRALADAGEYSRAEVTDYVDAVFRERRDRIGRYWLDVVTALEAFVLEARDQTWTLRFDDLAVERGYTPELGRGYRFEVRDIRLTKLFDGESSEVGELTFRAVGDIVVAPPDRWGRVPMVVVDVYTTRRDGEPAQPVRVVLGRDQADEKVHVLGWTHAPR